LESRLGRIKKIRMRTTSRIRKDGRIRKSKKIRKRSEIRRTRTRIASK
jgi:hypothetical protein